MKAQSGVPLGYHLHIYRREQLWLPAGLWVLFALIVAFTGSDAGRAYEAARAFLGFVVPLLGGILSASAIVDDTALELQFAAPRAPWRTLLERLAVLLAIVALAALAFQAYLAVAGVDISPLGGIAARQLVWLMPSVALMGLASLVALALAQGTGGALAAGLVWIMQLLLRGWFAASPWGRYLFLFLGAHLPGSPHLPANRLCLAALAAAFVVGASHLLKKEERYL